MFVLWKSGDNLPVKTNYAICSSSGTCKWKDLITCPGMFESVLVLVVSAPAQKWISSSLEPHLKDLVS